MVKVTAFYSFFSIPESALLGKKKQLLADGEKHGIRGLILIGPEGINATLSGKESSLEEYKEKVSSLFDQNFHYKDSFSEKWSFKRLSIKIKKEIIKINKQTPSLKKKGHLSPEEWEEELRKNPQILDIRNDYEIKIGRFKKSFDLNLKVFQEFSQKLKKTPLEKDKKTMIYCTGGIRCEKAMEIMEEQGFKEVYQLEGGILNYLKHYPNSHFKEECFVFDRRVAVDQNLKPSKKYNLCPHCGQPASIKLECSHCEKPFLTCKECLDKYPYAKTCSKNCSYHFKAGHTCNKKYKSSSIS